MDGPRFDRLARSLADQGTRRGVLKALASVTLGGVLGLRVPSVLATAPRITSGPTVPTKTATGATITWQTDAFADSRVSYGTTAAYGRRAIDPTLRKSHRITLAGLGPSTTYHYQVRSVNADGTQASADRTFATCPTARPRFCPGAGCIDPQTDERHCGSCTTACAADEVCSAGVCCAGGSTGCGGRCVRGIGTACNTGNPGVCALGTWRCVSGTKTCVQGRQPRAETCNGLDDDCDGVVDEDAPCPVGQACGEGRCQAGCRIDGTFYAPRTPNPTDACQSCQPTTSTTAWSNRADGTSCGTGGQTCSKGLCCPYGLTNCGGTCTDLQTSTTDCGECQSVCGACGGGEPHCCRNGECACGAECPDPCEGVTCPDGQTCSAGRCCPSGLTYCPVYDACIDVQTSVTDCGACQSVCGACAPPGTPNCCRGGECACGDECL